MGPALAVVLQDRNTLSAIAPRQACAQIGSYGFRAKPKGSSEADTRTVSDNDASRIARTRGMGAAIIGGTLVWRRSSAPPSHGLSGC